MSESAAHSDCLLCTMEDAEHASVIFRDELWAAEVVPGYEVPGWVILRVRRHAERITGLGEDELDGFACRARDLVAAVSTVMNAPATYLLVFGENYPHFHALISPRGEDVPVELRGGDILKLRAKCSDPGAARGMVPALRDAYAEAARQRTVDVAQRSVMVSTGMVRMRPTLLAVRDAARAANEEAEVQ